MGLSYPEKEEAFRRMVFNVLAANCDDHSKNFSFILHQGARWQLAPAYDLTHAFNPKGANTYQHLMSVNGKFSKIKRADFLAVGNRFGIETAPAVIRQVQEAIGNWDHFALRAGLSESRTARIRDNQKIWAVEK